MSVLVAWPTVDIVEANETAKIWQEMGYDTAILTEHEIELPWNLNSYMHIPEWKGFPHAANQLCRYYGSLYDIIVIGGNDLYPDQSKTAKEIEAEFKDHFGGTFGIMHPTGDRYGLIDEAAICPWIGAEYIDKAYQGEGPYCEEYYHYFCDGELQDVAIKHNAFWQRPDLSQYHDHWSRNQEQRPEHLIKAKDCHPADQRTYLNRKAQGFPGSELS
jgi:hypothetical protein